MKRFTMFIAAVSLLAFAACSSDNDTEENEVINTDNSTVDTDTSISEEEHEWVDLGLSVKWATCNVGASSPSDYGDYYAWGETETKSEYTAGNCETWNKNLSELRSDGIIDSSGNLTMQYDAARANWGGSWRLPTKEEWEELRDRCTWIWTTQDGNNGCKVTGPNGNSVFLPAAGWRDGTSLVLAGGVGSYWSSTPHEEESGHAYDVEFDDSYPYLFWGYRFCGRSVRPVSE